MAQALIRSTRLLFRCRAYLFDGSVGLFTDGLGLSRSCVRIARSLMICDPTGERFLHHRILKTTQFENKRVLVQHYHVIGDGCAL